MSIDDTSYFDSSNESYQDDYQTTEPTIEQLSGVIQSLQSKLSSLEANPLAGLGYQPIQQPSSQYDPTSLKKLKNFSKPKG